MSDKPNEQEAVRTTIVGGRPPGSGRTNVTVPRGIEVLLKKAAVDPEFRQELLERRDAAAAAIQLELEPAEHAMLKAIPDEQLKTIISQTTVPLEQRRVFLGQVAALMLATISAGLAGCTTKGIRPDRPAGSDQSNTNRASVQNPGFSALPDPLPRSQGSVGGTLGSRPDRP